MPFLLIRAFGFRAIAITALAVVVLVTVGSYSVRRRYGTRRAPEPELSRRLGVGRPVRVLRAIDAPGTLWLERGGLSRERTGDAVACSLSAAGADGAARADLPFSLSRGDSLHIERTERGAAPGVHAITAQVFDVRGVRRGLRVSFRCDGASKRRGSEVALRTVREAVGGYLQVD